MLTLKKSLLFFGLWGAFVQVFSQNITVSGFISDLKSGETKISASVFEGIHKKGTVTNAYGFYSLTIPKGPVRLQFSFVGYAPQVLELTLHRDTVIHIGLSESIHLQEITVVGHQRISGVQSTQMSAVEIPMAQIKAVPTLFGEADLIKALQLLPGVQSGTEGSSGMYVRGGGPDENLFLLDGIPIYNVNHLGGFFSVFNPDAIKNVTLYKGNFPARFGGRLSSVIDVRMNDGNDKSIHGNVSVGLISSKINVEGPIIKEKTTFNISARRTYYDLLFQPFIQYISRQNDPDQRILAGYYFYDLNAKVMHKLSDTDRLYASFYMGDDIIYTNIRRRYTSRFDELLNRQYTSSEYLKMDWNWGNLLGALRWSSVVNSQLFMNVTAAYTRYRYTMGIGNQTIYEQTNPPVHETDDIYIGYNSGIEDYIFKVDYDFHPHPNHAIKFGGHYTHHTFKPGVSRAQFSSVNNDSVTQSDTVFGNERLFAHQAIAYIEDNIRVNNALNVNIGLHYSTFKVRDAWYHSLQPRLGVRFLANDHLSFKAAYSAMSQYVHLLSNSNVSLPTDLWVPVTDRITPMRSHQYSVGAFYNFRNLLDFSVELYYKSMHNLIEYKDGASFLGSSTGWEDKVVMGDGRSYGMEFLVQKTLGRTTGWLGYTLARAERVFDRPGQELNFGKVFPAKFDRRHDISLVVFHKLNDRIDFSGTWVYGTGITGTLATQQFIGGVVPESNHWGYTNNPHIASELDYVSGRNNFRFNPSHRLDVGVNFHKKKEIGTRTWNISVYNLYNNNNPFFVYVDDSAGNWNPETNEYIRRRRLMQVSLFTIIPSVSYSYKW